MDMPLQENSDTERGDMPSRDSKNDQIEWQHSPENPRNWPVKRKFSTAATVTGNGFVSAMAVSIYAPGADAVAVQFQINKTVSLLPLSLFMVGMACGPIMSTLSETFGRKVVYLVTLPIFSIFTLGAGLSQDITSLIVCRFFGGVFAAPSLAIASACITDIFAPIDRTAPMSIYYTVSINGSLLGVLIGSFAVETKGWRWTQWSILFFNTLCLVAVGFLRESYRKILLRQRIKVRGEDSASGDHTSTRQAVMLFFRATVIRPVHMLLAEPIVGLVCLYCSFQFSLLYAFVVTSPYVFFTVYGFSPRSQGLTFLGFIIGSCFAPATIILLDRWFYRPKFAEFERMTKDPQNRELHASRFPPEHRLYSSMIGSIILPMGLFWFAWTARASIHWICPIVAQGVTIFGSVLIYVGANFYMMDTYGPLYGASAAGASSLCRYSLAAAFPLFTLQMYQDLGIEWATSLLGFCAVAMALIPWFLYHFGPRLRAKSKYECEL